MKKQFSLLFLSLLLFILTGCSLQSPENLYTLPELPSEYRDLNFKIQSMLSSLGAEYAAPLTGDNTQTVQLQDIDGDGNPEAIAFFRIASDPKPLKVYIFKQVNNNYSTYSVIEGEGTAIHAISYRDLNGDGSAEVVVSWRMSEKVHSLAAYSVYAETSVELMRTGYSGYGIVDIDMDSLQEIMVIHIDSAESNSRVELYDWQDSGMVLCSTTPLSTDLQGISEIRSGFLRDSIPALFISSLFGDSNGVLTDIITLRDGELTNLTLNPTTGQSAETMRYYDQVSCTDINRDSFLEIPIPVALPVYAKTPSTTDFWSIHWHQYDIDGTAWSIGNTFHNIQDRWYLDLPEDWNDNFCLTRRDSTLYGERAVIFSRWRGENLEPTPFLTIYRLTGANRELRSQIGNRFVILSTSDTVYTAEFHENAWNCGLTQDDLVTRFHLIRTEWSRTN